MKGEPETTRMLNATGSGKCLACGAPAGVHCEPCSRAREPVVRRATAMSILAEDHWPMMPAKETTDA